MSYRLDVVRATVADAVGNAGGLTFDPTRAGWQENFGSRSQLLFWGKQADSDLTGLLHPVQHNLGAAARTFEAHVLHSTGLDARVESCEEFWGNNALDPHLFSELLTGRQSPKVVGIDRNAIDRHARSLSPKIVGGSRG